MPMSMTGYGRSEGKENNKEIVAEIKSVNHRYLDFNIRLPRHYAFLEDRAREYIKNYISRGKVDVYLSIDSFKEDSREVILDEELVEGYINAMHTLEDKYKLKNDISVTSVAAFSDIFKVEKRKDDQEELWQAVSKVLGDAVSNFVSMRTREGARLKDDIIERGKYIISILEEIKARSPKVVEDYKEKIESRIRELLQSVPIDENRILIETAIFADKISITEEVVRLESHICELQNILWDDAPSGRKLDFLIQEMNREINTIGSKANDLNISKHVVEIKSEIEKIREQIQNIE